MAVVAFGASLTFGLAPWYVVLDESEVMSDRQAVAQE